MYTLKAASADPVKQTGPSRGTRLQPSGLCHLLSPQRAIRVRSHSMETMVSSQKKQHGGGIPGSLSGGITHNSVEVTKTTFSVRAACPEGGMQGAGKILQAPVGEAGARQLRAGMTEGN